MSHLKIDGLEEIEKELKKNVKMNDVKRVVRKNGADLQTKMQENADFTQGYQTGTTKRSVTLDILEEGRVAVVEPTTEYSPYLEYGTRFMDAQPFVRPAFNEVKEKFKRDMSKLVK